MAQSPLVLNSSADYTTTYNYIPYIPDVDLSMIGGNEEVINAASDIIRYIQNPKQFTRLGAKPPKGIILSGPPGVGKTYLAKAIAGHAQIHLFELNASELMGKWIGSTEENLRVLFKKAKQHTPCIICLNEIDSLGTKRSESPNGSGDKSFNSVVNQFLSLLDENNDGIFVIATTNNFNTLDKAFVREGRFDKHIIVTLPDVQDRETIFAVHTKNKPLDADVSFPDLASLSPGFSGAAIASWISNAAILATRRNANSISMQDFDEARTIQLLGLRKRQTNNYQQKRAVAIHESGHALVGHLLKKKINRVSILPYGDSRGFTETFPKEANDNYTAEEALNEICYTLGGRAAETVFQQLMIGSSCDLNKAKMFANNLVKMEGLGSSILGIQGELEIEYILQQQMDKAIKLIAQHKDTMELLVSALLEHNELTHHDFISVLNGIKITKPPINVSHYIPTLPNKILRPTAQKQAPQSVQAESIRPSTSRYTIYTKIEKTAAFPYSIEEVETALKLRGNQNIHKIKFTNKNTKKLLLIEMKLSFKNHEMMSKVSTRLMDEGIANNYMEGHNITYAKLIIYPKSVTKFINFIKNNSEEKQSNFKLE